MGILKFLVKILYYNNTAFKTKANSLKDSAAIAVNVLGRTGTDLS